MKPAPIPESEESRVGALNELAILDSAPEERFDRVTRLTQRLFGVPLAYISLIDSDRQWMKSQAGIPLPPEIPRAESFCAHAILDPNGVVVSDLVDDERFQDSAFVTQDPRLRFYASMPLDGPGGEPVGTLCIADTRPRDLTDHDLALFRDLTAWVAKEMNVTDELERAAEVQRAMLPQGPPASDTWEVAGACQPSREVSGDFYDWYSSRSGVVVTIGDVMGKGLPAAIVMSTVRAALRAGGRLPDLAAGTRAAAESLEDDLGATASFATAFLARLEPEGSVVHVDAGHGHAAVVRNDGRIEELGDSGGLPLGVMPDEPYRSAACTLAVGDLLVVHSDGYIEVPGGPQNTEQIAELVRGAGDAPAALERLRQLVGDKQLPDDATVIVARRIG